MPRATRDSVVNGGNELRSYSELYNDNDSDGIKWQYGAEWQWFT